MVLTRIPYGTNSSAHRSVSKIRAALAAPYCPDMASCGVQPEIDCDVDHRGSRPAFHMRQSEPHHSHGLYQVAFQRAAPILVAAVRDARSAAPATHIVDEDIDAAIGGDGGIDQAGRSLGIADVSRVPRNFAAGPAQRSLRFAQLLGRARRPH